MLAAIMSHHTVVDMNKAYLRLSKVVEIGSNFIPVKFFRISVKKDYENTVVLGFQILYSTCKFLRPSSIILSRLPQVILTAFLRICSVATCYEVFVTHSSVLFMVLKQHVVQDTFIIPHMTFVHVCNLANVRGIHDLSRFQKSNVQYQP